MSAIYRVAKREFGRIAERRMLYGLIIVAPIILFSLLAAIYGHKVVKDIPFAICDQDNTELSRTVVRMLESTRSLKITCYLQSEAEIQDAILRGKVQGGCVIPAGMEAQVKGGTSADGVIYKNSANLIVGNLIYRDAATVLKTVSGGVLLKKLRAKGMSEQQALSLINPIRADIYSLFNPGYNYSNFLVATLLPMILQMLIMMSGVTLFNTEIREGTFGDLWSAANGSAAAVALGKALPHIFIHSATMLGLFVLLFPLFGIPIYGSMTAAFLFSIYFVMSCLFPVMLVSAIVQDPQFGTEIAVFVSTPAFLFSGETFPIIAMPALYQVIAQLLPFTHFLSGFIKIQQFAAPLHYLLPDIAKLSLFIWPAFFGLIFVLSAKHRGLTAEAIALP
jgi:ABC-2 type transport system permease protein